MFTILSKRRTVHVDCFTCDPIAFHAKMAPASDFFPEWWKNTARKNECPYYKSGVENTIKSCIGLVDLYKNAFIQPSWIEINFDITSTQDTLDVRLTCSDTKTTFSQHSNSQFNLFASDTETQNIKLVNPWKYSSNKSAKFLMIEPTWDQFHFYNHVSVMPGVVDLKQINYMNINYLIRYHDGINQLCKINAFDPLFMIVPLSNADIKFHHHFVQSNDPRLISAPQYLINNQFRDPRDVTSTKKQIKKIGNFLN